MPPEITRLVSQFLKDPERIEVAPPATTAKTITQLFRFCPEGEDWAKREVLRELISSQNVKNAIIFCNRKVEVAILHKSLVKHGFSAGALHGDMDQKARMETLDKFRSGDLKLLAASDVAARGLDIPDVSHIFNFDLPWQPDDYVHRIGRTGRAGKEGVSTSLVTTDELKSLKDIEKMLGEPVVWIGEPPSEEEFAEAGKKRRGRGGRTPQRGRGGRPGAPSQARGEEAGRGGRQGGERRGGGQSRERREPRPEHREPRPEQRQERPHEQHAETRAPQGEPRAPRPERRAPRPENREPRPEQRSDQPRAARPQSPPPAAHASNGGEHRQPRAPEPAAQPRAAHQPRPERQRQPEGARSGFADNVPAFLRKPVKRPVKVAGE